MPDKIAVHVNGRTVEVPRGSSAAIAVALRGAACRTSVTGEVRTSFCGMGICFECRATINGQAHQRCCITLCEPGMTIRTDG